MKARRKGTNNPFKEIERIQLKDSDILYNIDVMEFEQDLITTHDTLSTELKTFDQTDEEKHWQEVRESAAIAAMQGVLSCGESAFSYQGVTEEIAKVAVDYADSLIEKLKNK